MRADRAVDRSASSGELAALADRVAQNERQLARSVTEPRSRVDTGSPDCRCRGLTE